MIGGGWNEDDADALAVRDRLAAQPGTPIGTTGDRYVTDGNDYLIQVAASPQTADLALLVRGTAPPSEIELHVLARFTRSLAALWQHDADARAAGRGSPAALPPGASARSRIHASRR